MFGFAMVTPLAQAPRETSARSTRMKKILTGLLAATTLGGAALATATPAAAQYYRGGYYGHRGGGNAAAIGLGAGLLGLAVGASLASPHYYSRPYYSYPSYGPGYGYGYYPAPAYSYGYYARPACRSHWRFDPYIGRNVLVERCYR